VAKPNRKEEKERLRQARLDAEKRASSGQRRKLLVGYVIAGVLALAVIVGIVVAVAGGGGAEGEAHILAVSGDTNDLKPDERDGTAPPEQQEFDLATAAKAANCTLREDLPDEGNTHLEEGDSPPDYKTNPPTSGNHITPPLQQADGAYLDPAEPINYVHSMEHGRILLQYSPDLPEADQLELRGLYDDMFSGALMFPNPDMPFDVAMTSWQNLLGCDTYEGAATLDAIRSFGIEKFGDSPEDVNAFGPLEIETTPATPGEGD